MDEYDVKLTSRAVAVLDEIYTYISQRLLEPQTALKQVERIENSILYPSNLPARCARRKAGAFANQDYRQMFVDNFTIVFRIDEANKAVIVVTVRYSQSLF